MANRSDNITYGLFCNLFSVMIPNTIMTIFNNGDYPKIISMFGVSITDYKHPDTMVSELPSLSVYTTHIEQQDFHYFHDGVVTFDVFFPPLIERSRKTEVSLVACEALMLTMKNEPFATALCDAIPGLKTFGWPMTAELIGTQQVQGVDCSVARGTCGYRVDIMQYYQYLESIGVTVEDPCDVVLPLIEDYILNVKNVGLTQPDKSDKQEK